jgi:zinc transport system substrate-binding protein
VYRFTAKILCITMLLMVMCAGVSFAAFWNNKPSIVTTTYPLYDFTKQIAGDKADVILLIPPGAEPHGWEPGPGDLIKIKKSKLFIYNGADLEGWIENMEGSILSNKKTLNASSTVNLLSAGDAVHEHTHGHEHGNVDPHIWLDPLNARKIVNAIAQALNEVDPGNAWYYSANAQNYNTQLAALHQEYSTALAPANGKEFVTTHAAFAYLAKRYGLKQSAIMGIDPEAEPTPETMATIIRHIRSENIRYIFVEPVLSTKLAETISRETGSQILVLNPIHEVSPEDISVGNTYISYMRNNLSNLKIAFGL